MTTTPAATTQHDNRPVPDLAQLPGDAFLTRREVARISGFALQTMKQWRGTDKGPRYVLIGGSVRYRVADVRSWLGLDG